MSKMRFTWFILGLSFASSTIASHKHILRRDDDAAPTEADIKTAEAPKRFIVEFAEVSFLHSPNTNNPALTFYQGTDAEAAAKELAASPDTIVLKVFNSGVFNGAAVLAGKENLDSLRAFAPVTQAWQSKKIMLAPSIGLKSFSKDATAMNYSIHGMTGVDKLHEAGILGKGVTVAVVDTGIDYMHSAVSVLYLW